MSFERSVPPPAEPAPPPAGTTGPLAAGSDGITPAIRLQILSTEHWSLLATRSMTWNEAFSRAQMFLSALSGGIVALALASQAMGFGPGFIVFALLLLPVLLFLGLATFVRLVDINSEDGKFLGGRTTALAFATTCGAVECADTSISATVALRH